MTDIFSIEESLELQDGGVVIDNDQYDYCSNDEVSRKWFFNKKMY